jgi:nucleoside-diphosphate-sugar epimerase
MANLPEQFAAISYGHPYPQKKTFTDEDWTILDNPAHPVAPYQKSKTIAERAAWDFITKEGGDMELAVVNPVGIFGPILAKTYGTSVEIVSRMINGKLPGLPHLILGVVDVRNVADLHLRAMTDPKAAGQRFIATAEGFYSFKDMALALKKRLGAKAKKVPTFVVPNFVLKLVGIVDPAVRLVVPELSKEKNATSEKAKTMLGWEPGSAEDSLVATAESLEQFGLIH